MALSSCAPSRSQEEARSGRCPADPFGSFWQGRRATLGRCWGRDSHGDAQTTGVIGPRRTVPKGPLAGVAADAPATAARLRAIRTSAPRGLISHPSCSRSTKNEHCRLTSRLARVDDGCVRASELHGVLSAHPFVVVQQPPELWGTEVELEQFVRLLGEMLSAGLVRNDHELSAITLNVANVTAPADPCRRSPQATLWPSPFDARATGHPKPVGCRRLTVADHL